jgi:hypothetical protein
VKVNGMTGMNGLDASAGNRSTTDKSIGRTLIDCSGIMRTPPRRSFRRAYAKRHARTIGLLVVLAAAVAIVSAVALVPSGKEKASQPTLVEKALSRPPGFPYSVVGYTYQSDGVTPWPYCDLIVKNNNTGESNTTTSDDVGYYSIDANEPLFFPSGCVNGDVIFVTATNGTAIGSNESVVDWDVVGFSWIDVTLNDLAIPEFSMVIVPVVGMMALVVVASLRRGNRVQ